MNINKREYFQSFGTALALIISTLALIVSLYEANLLRAQQKALVWPYLTIGPNYNNSGFSLIATNNGVGPALIKSVEVTYKDSVVTSFDDLLNAIKPDRAIGYDRLRMSTFNNTVMKAGEERLLFSMPWDDETRKISEGMYFVKVKIMYESVLGDQWVFNSEDNSHGEGAFKARKEFK